MKKKGRERNNQKSNNGGTKGREFSAGTISTYPGPKAQTKFLQSVWIAAHTNAFRELKMI